MIQNTTDETCNGLTFSKDRYCFKKFGARYCKDPVRPNSIPIANSISPVRINNFDVVSLLLVNGSIIVKCKSSGV